MYEWNTSRGLAAKSPKKQCKHTRLRYTLPLPIPGGIPTTIAYIKGLQAVNRLIFRWYMLTTNKVTPNTRKSILNAILYHFLKQLHQKKEPDRLKYSICSGLFFTFQSVSTICLRSACQLHTKYHPDSYSQGCIQKLSALYHLFHIFRCHI